MKFDDESKKLLSKYLRLEENVYFSERLFVAHTILNWVGSKEREIKVFKYYLKEVEKHLNGEITLYWENGIVRVRKEAQSAK